MAREISGGIDYDAQLEDLQNRTTAEIHKRTDAIFTVATLRAKSAVLTAFGIEKAPQTRTSDRVLLSETILGLLDSKFVSSYEEHFRDGFYELQQLGGSLKEDTDESTIQSTSETMHAKIGELNEHLQVIGGLPVEGARFASLYFTGEEGTATQRHRHFFSNFPFSGVVDRVEAILPPDATETDSGAFACMVVLPRETSPIAAVRERATQYPSPYEVTAETWIPIGGVEFRFGYIPATEQNVVAA